MMNRLTVIGKKVSAISGVTYEVREPGAGLSNRSAGLSVRWDSSKLGITGAEVSHILNTTDPRILVGGGGGRSGGGGRGGGQNQNEGQDGISVSGFNLG